MSWKLINCVSGEVWALPPSLLSPPSPAAPGEEEEANLRKTSSACVSRSPKVASSPLANSPSSPDPVDPAFSVGRSPRCAIRLADCGVSRIHGCFRVLPPSAANVCLSVRDVLPLPPDSDGSTPRRPRRQLEREAHGHCDRRPSGAARSSESSTVSLSTHPSSLASTLSSALGASPSASSTVPVNSEDGTETPHAADRTAVSDLVWWSASRTGRVFFVDVSSSGTRRNGALLRYPPELREAHRKTRLGKNAAVTAEDPTGERKWFELFDGDILRFGQCPVEFVLRFFPLVFCLSASTTLGRRASRTELECTDALPVSLAADGLQSTEEDAGDEQREGAQEAQPGTGETNEEKAETMDPRRVDDLLERGRWSGAYFLTDGWHPVCCALLVTEPASLPLTKVLGCVLANRPILSPACLSPPPEEPSSPAGPTSSSNASSSAFPLAAPPGVSASSVGCARGLYVVGCLLESLGASQSWAQSLRKRGETPGELAPRAEASAETAKEQKEVQSPQVAQLSERSSPAFMQRRSEEGAGEPDGAGEPRKKEGVFCCPEAAPDWRYLVPEEGRMALCVKSEKGVLFGREAEAAERSRGGGLADTRRKDGKEIVVADAYLPAAALSSSEILKRYAKQPLLISRRNLLRDAVFLFACPRSDGEQKKEKGKKNESQSAQDKSARENNEWRLAREEEPARSESKPRGEREEEEAHARHTLQRKSSNSLADVLRQSQTVVLDFFAEMPRHSSEELRASSTSSFSPSGSSFSSSSSSSSADLRRALSEALSLSEGESFVCGTFSSGLARWICEALGARERRDASLSVASPSLFDMADELRGLSEASDGTAPRSFDASVSITSSRPGETVNKEQRRQRAFVLVLPNETAASAADLDTDAANLVRAMISAMYLALGEYLCSRSASSRASVLPFSASAHASLKQLVEAGEMPQVFICSEEQVSLSVLLGRPLFPLARRISPVQAVDLSASMPSNSKHSASSPSAVDRVSYRLEESESLRRMREEALKDALLFAGKQNRDRRPESRENECEEEKSSRRQDDARTEEGGAERRAKAESLCRTPASQRPPEAKTTSLTPPPRSLPSSQKFRDSESAAVSTAWRETGSGTGEGQKLVKLVPVMGGMLSKREGEKTLETSELEQDAFSGNVSPVCLSSPSLGAGGWQRRRPRGRREELRENVQTREREDDASLFCERQTNECMNARGWSQERRGKRDQVRPENVKRFRKSRVYMHPGTALERVALAPVASPQLHDCLASPVLRPSRRNERGDGERCADLRQKRGEKEGHRTDWRRREGCLQEADLREGHLERGKPGGVCPGDSQLTCGRERRLTGPLGVSSSREEARSEKGGNTGVSLESENSHSCLLKDDEGNELAFESAGKTGERSGSEETVSQRRREPDGDRRFGRRLIIAEMVDEGQERKRRKARREEEEETVEAQRLTRGLQTRRKNSNAGSDGEQEESVEAPPSAERGLRKALQESEKELGRKKKDVRFSGARVADLRNENVAANSSESSDRRVCESLETPAQTAGAPKRRRLPWQQR
ncbi:hypothetical protein TGARI_222250 [Toxoplasma gondii ARI]|uniref:FHA domain-containing protein n=1 Tax=Toxoplasma gondii ARI TaxID=1074872 RepID=A0A139XUV1_TOXGO|nr:hypothetical protein TGARI_222250 [Toxoplasma gondii ARI]